MFQDASIRILSESGRNIYEQRTSAAQTPDSQPSSSPPLTFPSPPSAFSIYRRQSRTDLHNPSEEQEGLGGEPISFHSQTSSGFSSVSGTNLLYALENNRSAGASMTSGRGSTSAVNNSISHTPPDSPYNLHAGAKMTKAGIPKVVGDLSTALNLPFSNSKTSISQSYDSGVSRQTSNNTQVSLVSGSEESYIKEGRNIIIF